MGVESSSAWNLPFFLTGWRSCFRVCRPTSLMQTVSFQLRVKCGAAQSLDVQEFFRNRLRVGRGGAGEVSLQSPLSQIFSLCPASRWMRAGIWQAQGERLLSGIPSPEKARAVLRQQRMWESRDFSSGSTLFASHFPQHDKNQEKGARK